jgi:hypothetical protein
MKRVFELEDMRLKQAERFENSLFRVKKLPVFETTGSFMQASEFTLQNSH